MRERNSSEDLRGNPQSSSLLCDLNNDKNLDFLKHLFSKKKALPISEKKKIYKYKKFYLKLKKEKERKKSLERKNNILKQKLYKIKHNRSRLTRDYNYIMRKEMSHFVV